MAEENITRIVAGEASFDAPWWVGFTIFFSFLVYFVDTDTIFCFLKPKEIKPPNISYEDLKENVLYVRLFRFILRIMNFAIRLQEEEQKRRLRKEGDRKFMNLCNLEKDKYF